MKNMSASLAGALVLAFAFFQCSCSDDPAPPVADGSALDGGVLDGTGDSQPLDLGGDASLLSARDYVMRTIVIPKTEAEVSQYAFDLDGDGTPDNRLGAILNALSAAAPGIDLQRDMDQQILNGKVIILTQIKAHDFANHDAASLQGWTGEKTTCCPAIPCSPAEAAQTCFSGNYVFERAAGSPSGSALPAKIVQGELAAGPGTVQVLLPIGKFPVEVTLLGARLEGTIGSDGISAGKVGGAVSEAEIQGKVIPNVALVLDAEMKDPTTPAATQQAIADLFDTNKDGTVTAQEVADNALISALFKGDVDVDGDGKKELSAGVGFEAATCVIKAG